MDGKVKCMRERTWELLRVATVGVNCFINGSRRVTCAITGVVAQVFHQYSLIGHKAHTKGLHFRFFGNSLSSSETRMGKL